MKKILILEASKKKGSPAFERVESFRNFFESNNYCISTKPYPSSFNEVIDIYNEIKINHIDYLFISQPPFRFFLLFFIPNVKIILDYRDGWSIANLNGYGGLKKPNKIKYLITGFIERLCMNRAKLVITCTEGLKKYLTNKSKKDVLLVTNGVTLSNYSLIKKYNIEETNESKTLKFLCAGQFSEYGVNQVKRILDTISVRYVKFDCEIHIYGADEGKNSWVLNFIKKYPKLNLILHPRVSQQELYSYLSDADFFISVIRDPSFDYGTKVYEYIAFNKPILNYFDESNNFLEYFDGAFDKNIVKKVFDKEIIREKIIDCNSRAILEAMK